MNAFTTSPPARSLRCLSTTAALAVALMLGGCAAAPPPEPVTLRLNLFRVASNISIYMAREQGAFARRGIDLQLQFTPNSELQRAGLAAGRFEIAQAAVDNAVAMKSVAGADVVIVAGGDGGMNELLVNGDVGTLGQVRGASFVVDAPRTAYALVGRKILKDAGLVEGRDYRMEALGGTDVRTQGFLDRPGAVTLLNPPWSLIAKQRGARSLGSTVALFGPYQAQGIFVMRPWATAHAATLERFLAAYIEGCRATLDPAQREATLRVLARELSIDRPLAEATYRELVAPGSGLARDCAFDRAGFDRVLALRAEIEGQWNGRPPPPESFLDLGYYDRAAATLRR